jgi:surface polysaccharide O-acyltransferase-like enzyme
MKSERVLWAEGLRVAAMVAVVCVHVAAKEWYKTGVATFDWKVLNFYDSLFRWCVPVFVMLSGMFMLDPVKPLPARTLFGKNLLRITIAFFFWSAVYVLNDICMAGKSWPWTPAFQAKLWENFFFGRYHLWFLFLIAGLYLVTPVLRAVAADRRATTWFLALAAVFAVLLPSLTRVPGTAGLLTFMRKLTIQLPLGYGGYYLAGYYLKNRELSGRVRGWIYGLGVLGVVATVWGTDFLSIQQGKPDGILYGYLMPNVMLTSVAVFVFFRDRVGRIEWGERGRRLICWLAGNVFGVYLVHDLFNQWFREYAFRSTSFHPVLAVPVLVLLISGLSLGVVVLIGRIPGARKYIL